jgi:antirestriction protein ArdC
MKRKQVIDKINADILQALEQGVVPWRSPYKLQQSSKGHTYRGINKMILNLTCIVKDYDSPVWWTFNAARFRGAKVRKGSKATRIVYHGQGKSKQLDDDGKEKWFPVFKTFNVFNENQLDLPDTWEHEEAVASGAADEVIKDYLTRESIGLTHAPKAAWYDVSKDTINIPAHGALRDPEAYYSALFHEMGHSTGAESRLNRETLKSMGDQHLYSQEELVAEMCSAYLCGHTDTSLNIEQSAAYIDHWKKILTEDPACLHKACDQAEKAYQYVLKGEHDLYKGEEE